MKPDMLDVLDWRRRVHMLYRRVRQEPDPAAGHALWRAGREELFAGHPASPRRGGQRLAHAGYDPALRFTVPVAQATPQRIEVATGTDGVVPFDRVGVLRLPGLGSLDLWWMSGYGGGLFLPVRDAGSANYPGGRYLLDTVKGADLGGDRDGLVVDLNFAYNPSCAYDPAWACPLAPPGNVLPVPVGAGELLPVAG